MLFIYSFGCNKHCSVFVVNFQQRLQQKNELLDSCSIAEKNYENLRNFVLQINAMWIISRHDTSRLLFHHLIYM